MESKIQEFAGQVRAFVISSKEELENYRLQFISKKGSISELFEELKKLSKEEKQKLGKPLNELKQLAEAKFAEWQEKIAERNTGNEESIDFTLPPVPDTLGNQHPLTLTRNRIIEIFERLGFSVADGPEVEDDWHNFSALNFPENHPAREMQDTFFVENQKPPIRAIMPGRVYRNEAISARAHCFFHQVEGLYVDKNVGFADLKQALYHFAKEMYGQDTKIRFRPSFFPFTEPSAEIDISCLICKGKGCNVCKYSGWVEIAGSGMVHPNVLRHVGIDPEEYTGFAFGMGIERVTMLRYQVNDLRLYSENDIRFLRQFSTVV
jgi:phenylalanyl-tRNA synthetase alpha chain